MCLASETCCPFKGFVKDTHFVSIHICSIVTRSLSININTFCTSFMSHTCSKRCTQFDVCSETERKIHIRVVNVPGKRNFNINNIWILWSKWTFSEFAVTISTVAYYNTMPWHFEHQTAFPIIHSISIERTAIIAFFQQTFAIPFIRISCDWIVFRMEMKYITDCWHSSYHEIFMPMILLPCSASYY